MTTQSGSSSPFQPAASDQLSNPPAEFSFRTMQDDLLSAQKNASVDTTKTPGAPLEKQRPASDVQPKPPIQSAPQKKDFTSNPNPFLDQAVMPSSSNKEGLLTDTAPLRETKIIEVPTTETKHSQTNSSTYKVIVIIIIALSAGIVGLGGYYFWMTNTPKQTPVTQQPVIETPIPVEEPVIIVPPLEKYSSTNPNYLTIDLANLSSAEIQVTISAMASDLQNLSSQFPYEFIVVDANNNPIAFPIFATAAKLNFTPVLLSALGENFSLFLYNDNNNVRLGLSAAVLKADVLAAELQKQEKTFPTELAFMFLDSKSDVATGIFKDGSYDSYKTRYLNLNAQGTLSIDYAITDNKFILSTSKNTERAILDKITNKLMADIPNVPSIDCGSVTMTSLIKADGNKNTLTEAEKISMRCASKALVACAASTIAFSGDQTATNSIFEIKNKESDTCVITGVWGDLEEKTTCKIPLAFINDMNEAVLEKNQTNDLIFATIPIMFTMDAFSKTSTNNSASPWTNMKTGKKVDVSCTKN